MLKRCALGPVCAFACVCVHQVVILERRNAAGKTLYKPVTAWNGSEEDQKALVDELERLHKDPSILNYDATLPELNNEFASVCRAPPPPPAQPPLPLKK